MSSTLPDVLAEVRAILRTLPGLNPADQPGEQDESPIITLVYTREGRAQLATSRGGTGPPNFWKFATITIEVLTNRSDLAADLETLEPYTHLVDHALMAAFSANKWNNTIQVLGDPGSPGSNWPIRCELMLEDRSDIAVVGYLFEVDVSYQVEILHD